MEHTGNQGPQFHHNVAPLPSISTNSSSVRREKRGRQRRERTGVTLSVIKRKAQRLCAKYSRIFPRFASKNALNCIFARQFLSAQSVSCYALVRHKRAIRPEKR